jgi:RNA polymerase sigma-70 factor (ECF subfamily)
MDSHDSYTRGRSLGRSDANGAANGRGSASVADGESLVAGQADEDLLRRFRVKDDTAAYETLVHRYERELFSYLRRYLGSAEMAEDVFQATFLQVYLKKENFEDGRRFRPWLYTIATNQAIDAQRRNRRHRMVSIDQRAGGDDDVGALVEMLSGRDQTADEQMSDEEARQWVRSAVDDLPESLKGTVLLVYHQGMKYREAADALGIPVGTVKSRLHAALLKLNESWSASGRSQ